MENHNGRPWKWTKFHIVDGLVCQLIGEEKWESDQLIVEKCLQRAKENLLLDCKELLSDRGLQIHVFGGYWNFKPFLKVSHLTLESHYLN